MQQLKQVLDSTNYSINATKIIPTSRDFDQSNLTELQIDQKISDIINSQSSAKLKDIVTPINNTKLIFLGKIHPAEKIGESWCSNEPAKS